MLLVYLNQILLLKRRLNFVSIIFFNEKIICQRENIFLTDSFGENNDKLCFCRGDETKYSTKPIVTMAAGTQYYDILTRLDLQDEDLPELATLKCTLSIPMANYNVSRELIYQPGQYPCNNKLISNIVFNGF